MYGYQVEIYGLAKEWAIVVINGGQLIICLHRKIDGNIRCNVFVRMLPPDACQGFGCSPFGPELKGSGWLEIKFITLQSLRRGEVDTVRTRSEVESKIATA